MNDLEEYFVMLKFHRFRSVPFQENGTHKRRHKLYLIAIYTRLPFGFAMVHKRVQIVAICTILPFRWLMVHMMLGLP